jgi:hypothetical protein
MGNLSLLLVSVQNAAESAIVGIAKHCVLAREYGALLEGILCISNGVPDESAHRP